MPAVRIDGSHRRAEHDQATTTASARFELSLAQVLGSAVAAMAAAAVASTLGVAGTIAGAAVGAVVATVAGAIGTHSMRRAGDRLRVLTPRRPRTASSTPAARECPPPAEPERATTPPPPVRRSPASTAVVVCMAAVTVAVVVGIVRVTGDLGAHPWLVVQARELLDLAGRNLRSLPVVLSR